jgi:hypothetical protein
MSLRQRLLATPLHERYTVRKAASWLLPDRYYAKLAFRQDHGRFPRTPPVSYNERLSALIGSGSLERYQRYCDKLAVREWVAGRVGAQHLVPLHASADRLTPELWDRLPDAFMLKPTHGSSWFRLVQDKRAERYETLAAMTDAWLRMNYYYFYRERQYRSIRPALLFEKVLGGGRAGGLVDYKFFCFHGKALFVYVLIELGRKRRLLYDLDWNKLAVRYKADNDGDYPRPAALDEMRTIAETLAQGFDFVRVDLYSVPEGTLFGEMTFTPLTGSDGFDPPAFDDFLGTIWASSDGGKDVDLSPWRALAAEAPRAPETEPVRASIGSA